MRNERREDSVGVIANFPKCQKRSPQLQESAAVGLESTITAPTALHFMKDGAFSKDSICQHLLDLNGLYMLDRFNRGIGTADFAQELSGCVQHGQIHAMPTR